MTELRQAEGLISGLFFPKLKSRPVVIRTLSAEAFVPLPPVLPGPRHTERVDTRVSEHARKRANDHLVSVGLAPEGFLSGTRYDNRMLRCVLAQPPGRPGVVGVDLVVEPGKRVPTRPILGNREVEGRPRGEQPRAVRVVDLPFETEEEMSLVSHDWTADHKPPLTF